MGSGSRKTTDQVCGRAGDGIQSQTSVESVWRPDITDKPMWWARMPKEYWSGWRLRDDFCRNQVKARRREMLLELLLGEL